MTTITNIIQYKTSNPRSLRLQNYKSIRMKNITILSLIILLAISCGEKPVDLTNVAEVKAELKKKKEAKKKLESEIEDLTDKILELEPRKEKAP